MQAKSVKKSAHTLHHDQDSKSQSGPCSEKEEKQRDPAPAVDTEGKFHHHGPQYFRQL